MELNDFPSERRSRLAVFIGRLQHAFAQGRRVPGGAGLRKQLGVVWRAYVNDRALDRRLRRLYGGR